VSVIQDWRDRQAVANLLFHPDVMPASVRFEALDRALHSCDIPYFILAATVGLQGVPFAEIPSDKRAAWIQRLLGLVQSTWKAQAGRASVTLASWLEGAAASDILAALVSLYPVPDEGASRNIVAMVLATWGDWPEDEFGRQLSELRVSGATATAFRHAHEEYTRKKAQDVFRAMIMKTPALSYIPNLCDGAVGNVRGAELEPAGGITRKPWWQFW
jgi:hypothetical protein